MAKKDPATESLARKIWLAGLGAYGRAVTDAAENVAKAGHETAKRFEELAQRGADIESKTADMMTQQVKLFDRPPLDERLAMFRNAFGLPAKAGEKTTDGVSKEGTETAEADRMAVDKGAEKSDNSAETDALKAQIFELRAQVDALAASLEKDDS